MRLLPIVILLFPVAVFAQKKIKYKLPDAELKSKTICGQKKVCDPGPRRGIIYRFNKEPFSPTISKNSTKESIALSILGHGVSKGEDENSEKLEVFSNDRINSPFKEENITPTGEYGFKGRDFKYISNDTLKIKIGSTIEANIKELLKVNDNINTKIIDSLKASLKLFYGKINNKVLAVKANYSEWALTDKTIRLIEYSDDYKKQRKLFQTEGLAIITDISLVKYSIDFKNTNIKEMGINLNAILKRNGFNIDFESMVENKVHEELTSDVVHGFQIIGWRKMTL